MSQFTVSAWAESTKYDPAYSGAQAGNGIRGISDRWLTNGTAMPQWISADLGTAKVVEWYRVTGSYGNAQDPTAWTFEGSNDGVSWTTLDARSGVTWANGGIESKGFAVTNVTAYRYHRLHVTASTSSYLSLTEVTLGDGPLPSLLLDHRVMGQNDNGALSLGVVVRADKAGTLARFAVWAHLAGTGTFRIYDDAGATLRTQSFTVSGALGWVEFDFDSPLTVTAGQHFMVAVQAASSASYSLQSFGSPLVYGDLTIPAAGTVTFDGATFVARYGTAGTKPSNTLGAVPGVAVYLTPSSAPAGVTGVGVATAPAAGASGTGLAPTVTTTGTGTATAPTPNAAGAGTVTTPSTTGTGEATAPVPGASGEGDSGAPSDRAATSLTHTPVGVLVVLPLVPSTELAESAPIVRVSHQMPGLTQADPAYTARIDYPLVKSVIGHVHLWIAGRDVTYFRDAVTVIRRWESETPFGDTAAAFEFPQLNPWDVPGEGDLDFLYPDAPVAIGIVSEAGVVRRVWSGFLDARGNGTAGEREDYAWEAKGAMWQAAHQVREPYAILEPTDIGVLIARTLNAVIARRWAALPETPIGIPTLTRGSRDEMHWDYVQQLLSEAVTDAGEQWTLAEVAPSVFRLVLKPSSSTVHATVAYGTPGVDIDLRIDESTRVDGFYARGIGPGAGGWANVLYPGVELLNPPPYPNANPAQYMNAGATDAGTTSGTGVTDWQRRVTEIGAWATPPVSGVMSSAWVAVVDDIQRTLGVTADSSIGPQTWNAVFDRGAEGIDMRPLRLPIAVKPWVLPNTYSATGVTLGENPLHDDTRVPRLVPLDLGPGKTKAQGRALCRTLLDLYGEAAAHGTATWQFDPNETDRTQLSHLSNVKVLGHEGVDRVLQVSSKSVELESGDDGALYVVTTRLDERARDAMAVEDLLEQRRSAQVDPSKRPGGQAKASRTVNDQRTPWDSESPCGILRRTAVNGSTGLWSIVTVPFAEVGKLAGIRLTSTQPFALVLLASLRITENKMAAIAGDPFAEGFDWRAVKDALDEYGVIEAWGEPGNACGYSPKTETDGGAFTGRFELDTPVDYWTETPPYVSVAIWMRGGSGFISGEFLPAYEG